MLVSSKACPLARLLAKHANKPVHMARQYNSWNMNTYVDATQTCAYLIKRSFERSQMEQGLDPDGKVPSRFARFSALSAFLRSRLSSFVSPDLGEAMQTETRLLYFL